MQAIDQEYGTSDVAVASVVQQLIESGDFALRLFFELELDPAEDDPPAVEWANMSEDGTSLRFGLSDETEFVIDIRRAR